MYKTRFYLFLLAAALSGVPAEAANKRDTEIANRAAQWQIDNFGKHLSRPGTRSDQHWANGALYRGMLTWAEVSGYKPCEEFILGIGRRNGSRMGRGRDNAADS